MTDTKKEKIKHAFSRSAPTYDTYADIQKELSDLLQEYLNAISAKRILELGCATGNYTLALARKFAHASIISVDFSGEMINRAKDKLADIQNVSFLCSDAEDFMSSACGSFDLITSNATLHWFSQLEEVFHNIHRMMTEDGICLCSIMGPETLIELEQALGHVLEQPVTLPAKDFPTKDQLVTDMKSVFQRVEIEEKMVKRSYANTLELLRCMRYTGVTGIRPALPSPVTKKHLRKIDTWFLQNYGTCLITYQVFILNVSKHVRMSA